MTPRANVQASVRAARHRVPPPGRRLTVLGALGESLVTIGALLLLFLGWQQWWNPLVLAGEQASAAAAQSSSWMAQARASAPLAAPGATPAATIPAATNAPSPSPSVTAAAAPPVMKPVAPAHAFAVLYVPRFGANYKRVIKETVDEATVLNSYTSGIGHYPGTQMPGGVGNFAIAGHDTGWGNALIDVTKLQLGDKIYIQTKDGWYTYAFRNFEYVQPSAVSVLWPVPRAQDVTPADRLITITTCNPPWHAAERVITYGIFDSWQPLSAGAPAAIAAAAGQRG
ncbi:MAG: class E sortase [Microbacteriaceae bacterium]